MMPHRDDSAELIALKMRQWNLLQLFHGELSRALFERADAELRQLWKDWEAYDQKQGIV